MFRVRGPWWFLQVLLPVVTGILIGSAGFTGIAWGLDDPATPAGTEAKTEKEMKPYKQIITSTEVSFEMVPIPGGEFVMGSPDKETKRNKDEGPQHTVKIEPFWIGKYEVTWDEYDIWSFELDIQRRKILKLPSTKYDKFADVVTRPTKPYTDMTFDMGHENFPAICMTQLAAKTYCKWLSAKTGHYYRLPTEAEWEYACRAGSKTAYFFGDDPKQLDAYAWHYGNSDDTYHTVGKKKPNPWGLYDIHGNVAEWTLDQHSPDYYKQFAKKTAVSPLNVATKLFPRVVRGGSWDDYPEVLRSSARVASSKEWKEQDPQLPQSIWYHTDALHVGFRIVRPLRVPNAAERKTLNLDPGRTSKYDTDGRK